MNRKRKELVKRVSRAGETNGKVSWHAAKEGVHGRTREKGNFWSEHKSMNGWIMDRAETVLIRLVNGKMMRKHED